MNYTGISPKDPNKYLGPNVYTSSIVNRKRRPTSADYKQPETGKLYPLGSFWLVGPNPTTGAQGEIWYLSKIVSNVAYWKQMAVGVATESFQVDAVTAPGVNPVTPTVAGLVTLTGTAVANHSVPVETRSTALNSMHVDVQYAATSATTDATKSGLTHLSSTQFNVDANGFVTLLSGTGGAIQSVTVQSTSGTGTNPVLSTVSGGLTLQASTVAAGTNPVRTVSTAQSTIDIQAQISQAIAATDATKIGLSNFDSAYFTVDANGFVKLKGSSVTPGIAGVSNLGISYNAGTGVFKITSKDGTALSASNPAYITLQNRSSPGLFVTITVTADQDFIDDNGASEIIGNLFGLTTGVATTVDIPFFIYAVSNDAQNAVAFMISRFPNASLSPVDTKIGKPSNAIADTQGSFFSIENITATDYDSNPCLSIGSFRMRMSAADDWTVQTINNTDGIGLFQQGVKFTYPKGQFGSSSGKDFKDNGGTACADTNGAYVYYVFHLDNVFRYFLNYPAMTTGGVGAVNAQLGLPYNVDTTGSNGSGNSYTASIPLITIHISNVTQGTNTQIFPYINAVTNGYLKNADFLLGDSVEHHGESVIQFS